MAENQEIEQLQRQLMREAPVPLLNLANQMTTTVFLLLRKLVGSVRAAGEEHPLVSVLLAFEAGLVIARLGARHAKH